MKQILVSRELLRQVLDFIIATNKSSQFWLVPESNLNKVVSALREALEQPAVEPVAYIHMPKYSIDGKVRPVVSFERYEDDYAAGIYSERIPLFTAPQAQQPVAKVIWPSAAGLPSIEWVTAGMALYAAPQAQQPKTISELQAHIDVQVRDKPCNPHPAAPHGFDRTASHTESRYVCRCEYWEPDGYKPTENEGSEP